MSAINLMIEIIREHSPNNIWINSPLADYRRLGNTNRGQIGEEVVRRFLDKNGIKTGNGNRTSPTKLRLEKFRFEVKTASLGANDTFQVTISEWTGTTIIYCALESVPKQSSITFGVKALCPKTGLVNLSVWPKINLLPIS